MKVRIRWDLAKQLIAHVETLGLVAACKQLRRNKFLRLRECKHIVDALRDGNFELEMTHALGPVCPAVLIVQIEVSEITLDTTNTPPIPDV